MSAEEKAPKTLYLQSSHLQIHWPDGTQTAHALKKDVTRIGRGEDWRPACGDETAAA